MSLSQRKPKVTDYDPYKQELIPGLEKTFTYGGNKVKDAILDASKQVGVDPYFLYSSAMQEGMNKAIFKPDEVSEAYNHYGNKNKDIFNYPVDGFYNYGLDTFGGRYKEFSKYLPSDFQNRFMTYDAMNDATKPQKIKTVAFKNNQDALLAKAAMLRDTYDKLDAYTKTKNITLTPKQRDFFVGSTYNLGNFESILNSYNEKGYLKNDDFLNDGFKPASYASVYDHVSPRVRNAYKLRDEKVFKMGGRVKAEFGDEIDPLTGQPVPQQFNPNNKVGLSIFPEDTGEGFPSRDQQPGDLMTVNNVGDPIDSNGNIIPIKDPGIPIPSSLKNSKFFDENGRISEDFISQHMNDMRNNVQHMANVDMRNKKTLNFYEDVDKAEEYATAGMTAINAFFAKKEGAKQGRDNTRNAILNESFANKINPYMEGTGSQAIFEKGGKISGDHLGLKTLDGGKTVLASSSDHSNPMVEFKGKEHKEGGIGIAYGGKIAEVENKELGFIDAEGGLNIFGKLKVPGTNKSFRSLAKDVAKQESKVDGNKAKYLQILNGADKADVYQQSALSTAKVMFKSLDKQSKEIAEKKEAMASYQNLILSMKEEQESMAYGGKMPRKPYADGGEIERLMKALGQYEGANDYKARGKEIKKGQYKGQRALGKYQVMPGNLTDWSKEALGKSITEEEFLNNPDLQDKIVLHRLGEINKQHPDVKDIASVWFSGRPAKGNSSSDGNNTVPQYVTNVMKIYNNGETSGDPYPKQFKGFKGVDIPQGLSPEAFYKDPDVVQALKDDKTYSSAADGVFGPEHLKAWNNLSQEKKDALIKKSQATTGGNTLVSSDVNYTPTYVPIDNSDKSVETKYGKANHTPTQFNGEVNLGSGEVKRGFLSPLAIEQIAPELLTMATNRREPVNQAMYQPDLKQTFDMSYQLGRNTNQSSFNQVAKIMENNGNVDAISELAAQKYVADQQYNMQEVQGNTQQKLQTYNQNVDTLNDARLKNLALVADQQTKQAQAKFNTRKEDLGAFASISSKVLQNNLENKTYNAYANLFKHYGFDKKGNVTFNPDDVVNKFNPGEAQQFGMLAAKQGIQSLMNDATKTSTKVDKDGNVKQTTYVNDDLNEFNSIMDNKNYDPAYKQKLLKGNKYAERYFAPE